MAASPKSNEEWKAWIASRSSEIPSTLPSDGFVTVNSAGDDAFAATIDHTLLKPEATPAMIDELCDQALKYRFKVGW